MYTVNEIIEELKKHPSDKKVYLELKGSIHYGELEVVERTIPDNMRFEDGQQDVLTIRPKKD